MKIYGGANAIKLQTADPDENYSKGTIEYDIYSRSFLGPEATASIFEYPCLCRALANSTIRILFLAINPTRVTSPT